MKKTLITVGLSSDLVITKEIVEQIGKLTTIINALIGERVARVISTKHSETMVAAEIMIQILKALGSLNSETRADFPYQENSTEILEYEYWREFINEEFRFYGVLIVICKDNKRYAPNQIRVQKSFFHEGKAVEFKPVFFN